MTYTARDNYQYAQLFQSFDFDPPGGTPTRRVRKTLVLDQDADFAIVKLEYQLFLGAIDQSAPTSGGNQIGGFTLRIYDSTSGRFWSDDFVNIDTVFGNGSLPFILSTPKIMASNAELTIDLISDVAILTADNPNFSLTLTFSGNKLFQ